MINNLDNLIKLILTDKPLSVVRMGNVEITSLLQKEGIYKQMYTNAGFYGDEEIYRIWKKLYVQSLLKCDCLLDVYTCNSFAITGDLLVKLNLWKPTLPYYEDPSWYVNILNLIQEPIGIVSFFKKDIEKQIPKMDKIWGVKGLAKKKYVVVKAFQTIKGNTPHNNWHETYVAMQNRIDKHPEVKVWFLSCGCYGMPLCDYIKSKGGRAIYVGGILQLFFGLRGNRWEDRPNVKKLINSSWKFPTEKPENFNEVESGCYWGSEQES
jgi:hypothetical protein